MLARAGKADAYHATITIAFLSLISERLADERDQTFGKLEVENSDLFDRALLLGYYSEERLYSSLARETFLLPDRVCS